MLILGAGPLGQAALEIFQQNDMVVYGFLDDDTSLHSTTCQHVPILGSTDDATYLALLGKECGAYVALDTMAQRKHIAAALQAQYPLALVNAIHPRAQLASSATAGHGNLINAGATLGIHVSIGNHNTIHTHATLEQGATIDDHVEVGAGSVVGAGVTIHREAFIGPGATIIGGVEIGAGASVGAGAVVLASVPAGTAVLGNPAQPVQR